MPNSDAKRLMLQPGGHLAQNLSGMGGPTSSQAATGIAFEFTSVCRHCLPADSAFNKMEIPSRERENLILYSNSEQLSFTVIF
jgi:hypothetical protein